MYSLAPAVTAPQLPWPRLVLRAAPVTQLDSYALIFWFRRWLARENYRGCARIQAELCAREAAGVLPVAQLVHGLRDPRTGEPDLAGLNGLLDAWPRRYPALFTRRAAAAWWLVTNQPVASRFVTW